MGLYEVNYELNEVGRAEIRNELLEVFSAELPGTGTGDGSSKYRYCVESYDGYKIILHRPAPLNKGLDFIVRIEGLYFKKNRRYTNPGHSDLVDSLRQAKDTLAHVEYEKISFELNNIYECKNYNLSVISGFKFQDYEGCNHPIAIILLAAKWLFIEQDMTYWNWSGRNMLWRALKEAGVV